MKYFYPVAIIIWLSLNPMVFVYSQAFDTCFLYPGLCDGSNEPEGTDAPCGDEDFNNWKDWPGPEETSTSVDPSSYNEISEPTSCGMVDLDRHLDLFIDKQQADLQQADCAGANKFNPYTGNVHREIQDLKVWGAVGEVPLIWTRYFNSRALDKWTYSFNYFMYDSGVGRLSIHFPEGGETIFTQYSDGPFWFPPQGVSKRLFRDGNDFWLQLANGNRYRFEKLTDENNNPYYQLQDFRDRRQNVYTLTYNSERHLSRVTEPAGRYLEIFYETVNNKQVISKVFSSDGATFIDSVTYNYHVFPPDDSSKIWEILGSVFYSDGGLAFYNYSQKKAGVPPDVILAKDPRFVGNTPVMEYYYNDSMAYKGGITGYILQEKNGVNGAIMATLIPSKDKRTVCYPNGRTEIFDMSSAMQGETTKHRDGLGRLTEYTYHTAFDGVGFMYSLTDAHSRTTTFDAVTGFGNPKQITHPDGSQEKWTRDDLDLVKTYTDQLNRVTTYDRDQFHRVTRINYPDKTDESFTYNEFGQVLEHRRRNGGKDSSFYDSTGLLIIFKDAERNVTQFTYNNASQLDSVTDARGNITRRKFNKRGLLEKFTHADSSSIKYEYDEFGNRTKVVDELGHIWETKFDEFNRPDSIIDPIGRLTQFKYDLPGGACGCSHADIKPTKQILPSGLVIEMEYNVEGEMVRQTIAPGSPGEATTFYEPDLVGNPTSKIDPKLKEWGYEYNYRGQLTKDVSNFTVFAYDSVGNVKERRVGLSAKRGIENKYDSMNRLNMIIDQLGQISEMSYDAEGNIISLTDPKKNTYKFAYDLLNRMTKITYPNGTYESFTYDEVGNLKTYKQVAGQIRTYTYDNRNRETKSVWTSIWAHHKTPATERTYDDASRVSTITNSVSALTYKYNEANELISETQAIAEAGHPKTLTYTYNKDGLRETLTYPNGSQLVYNYTTTNQIASIVGEVSIVQYNYDLNGNRITKVLQNGTGSVYRYDDKNRMLSLLNANQIGIFSRFDYDYDEKNRKSFVKRDNKLDSFFYDEIDQITTVRYANGQRTVNYVWDSAGNRKTVDDNGIITNYISNNLNQYTNIGDDTANWFLNKNLRSFNGWTYKYDGLNRLVHAQKGSTTMTFEYDAINRCVKRRVNRITTFFYYDGWNLIEERNAAGILKASYVHGAGIDEILTKSTATGHVYYHQDDLNNVTHLTDAQGQVIEQYSYDVFGTPTIMNGNGDIIETSAFFNRFMFTGREYIHEIGLYDYRNRMYSPNMGRFLQTDPIRFRAGDYNLYRYVGNNPVNYVDAYGIEWEWRDLVWLGGTIAATAGYVGAVLSVLTPVGFAIASIAYVAAGVALYSEYRGSETSKSNNAHRSGSGEGRLIWDKDGTIRLVFDNSSEHKDQMKDNCAK